MFIKLSTNYVYTKKVYTVYGGLHAFTFYNDAMIIICMHLMSVPVLLCTDTVYWRCWIHRLCLKKCIGHLEFHVVILRYRMVFPVLYTLFKHWIRLIELPDIPEFTKSYIDNIINTKSWSPLHVVQK